MMITVEIQSQSESLICWENRVGEKVPIMHIIYSINKPKYKIGIPSLAGDTIGKHIYSV
jgi:hypothetical protein